MRTPLLSLLLALGLLASGLPASAQSLWLEAGLAYDETETEGYETLARVGVRGVQPLGETAGIYAAFSLRRSLLLDLGGWFSFLPDEDDLFGFRSYAGTGLTYAGGAFGVALSAALTYELSPQTALALVYTHRPLFLPELAQDFDISVGVQVNLPLNTP